jgi:hypothetical protein
MWLSFPSALLVPRIRLGHPSNHPKPSFYPLRPPPVLNNCLLLSSQRPKSSFSQEIPPTFPIPSAPKLQIYNRNHPTPPPYNFTASQTLLLFYCHELTFSPFLSNFTHIFTMFAFTVGSLDEKVVGISSAFHNIKLSPT